MEKKATKLSMSGALRRDISGERFQKPKRAAYLTPHQRIVLGMMLRRKPAQFSVAEISAFYWQTVHGLAVRELIAFQWGRGELYVVPTDEGRLASHTSPPVEVVMEELKTKI